IVDETAGGAPAAGEAPVGGNCWAGRSGTIKAVPRIAVVRTEVGRRKTRLLAGWCGQARRRRREPATLRFHSTLRLSGPHAAGRSKTRHPKDPTFLAGPSLRDRA